MKQITGMLMALLIFTISLQAQPEERDARVEEAIKKRIAYLDDALSLSDEQESAIEKILEYGQQQKKDLREQQKDDRRAIRTAMQDIEKLTQQQIQAQLDDEQKNKYAEIKQKRRDQYPELQRLTERLQLSEAQVAELTPIFEDGRADFEETRGRGRGHRREMKKLIEERDRQIEAVLTEEQKEEYEKLKKERREQIRQRRPDGPQRRRR